MNSTYTLILAALLAGLLPQTPKVLPIEDESVASGIRGLLVQEAGATHATYVKWESEATLQDVLSGLRRSRGGRIQWLPGQYEIHKGLVLWRNHNVEIHGSEGTKLFFSPEPEKRPRTTQAMVQGSQSMYVDDSTGMHVGCKYQLYPASGKGDRVLEFEVGAIEGNKLTLLRKVVFMPHVTQVPASSMIVEEVNFFRVNSSKNVTISGLHMDGQSRGDTAGHTTYSGIIATGILPEGKETKIKGLRIENCTFRGLKGRGIAVYRTSDVSIRGNLLENVRSEAIELDHYSTGEVIGNEIHHAGVGVALNDAFDSVVSCNTIEDCSIGVSIYRHFNKIWVNKNHQVDSNIITPAPGCAGIVFNTPMTGHRILNNFFVGCPEERWIIQGEGNTLSGNVSILD